MKRIVALLAVIALALCVSACGGQQEKSSVAVTPAAAPSEKVYVGTNLSVSTDNGDFEFRIHSLSRQVDKTNSLRSDSAITDAQTVAMMLVTVDNKSYKGGSIPIGDYLTVKDSGGNEIKPMLDAWEWDDKYVAAPDGNVSCGPGESGDYAIYYAIPNDDKKLDVTIDKYEITNLNVMG